jgi:hypothetical protein
MLPLFLGLDPYLIRLYRLTGYAHVDFVMGTLALAFLTISLGEACTFLARLVVGKLVDGVAAEATKFQDLSMEALKAGDRQSYNAANKLASDAFGKSFCQQLALSAAFFWPVFLALGWMATRFGEVDFTIPFTDLSLGYFGVFLPLYVAAYLIFRQVKRRMVAWRRGRLELTGPGKPPAARSNTLGQVG